MKEYIFDLSKIRSLNDWWDMYIQVVQGDGREYFGRNRDAYSDSLSGGPGCPEYPCRFVFTNIDKVAHEDLSKWTQQELSIKKSKCHSSWIRYIDMQMELLERGIGETLHHWIIDPVMGHKQIEVVIKNVS